MDITKLVDTKITKSELIDLIVHEATERLNAEIKKLDALRVTGDQIPKPSLAEVLPVLPKARCQVSIHAYDKRFQISIHADVKRSAFPERAAHVAAMEANRKECQRLINERAEINGKSMRLKLLKDILKRTAEGREFLKLMDKLTPRLAPAVRRQRLLKVG